jgi:hypothetical protein
VSRFEGHELPRGSTQQGQPEDIPNEDSDRDPTRDVACCDSTGVGASEGLRRGSGRPF